MFKCVIFCLRSCTAADSNLKVLHEAHASREPSLVHLYEIFRPSVMADASAMLCVLRARGVVAAIGAALIAPQLKLRACYTTTAGHLD